MYATAEIAEDVLIESWTRYHYAPGHGPVAIYKCEDCGQFHLTSSGTMNAKLAQFIKDGKISQQREANYWLNKFKKKK